MLFGWNRSEKSFQCLASGFADSFGVPIVDRTQHEHYLYVITQDKKHFVKKIPLPSQYHLEKFDDKQKMYIINLAGTNDWNEVGTVNESIIPN